MIEPLSDAQWDGIRVLCEGAAPTHERVAQAAKVYVKTISRRAAKDGWKTLDFRWQRVRAAHRDMIALAASLREGEDFDPVREDVPVFLDEAGEATLSDCDPVELAPLSDLPPGARIARIGAILTRRTEAILRRIEAGQPVESRQVAALSSLVQLSERIAVLAQQNVEREKEKSAEELAALLAKLDERIVCLATSYARKIMLELVGMEQAEVDRLVPEMEDEPRGRQDDPQGGQPSEADLTPPAASPC